jgi:hypothetical protein
MNRITWDIQKWFTGYRAVVYVDNLPVAKEMFGTEADALSWCVNKEIELSAVVRE